MSYRNNRQLALTEHGFRTPLLSRTVVAYNADVRQFEGWCRTYRFEPYPTSGTVLAGYIGDMSSRAKRGTIQRAVTAIAWKNRSYGHPSPTSDLLVREALRVLASRKGNAKRPLVPVSADEFRAALTTLSQGTLAAQRDLALLLFIYVGGVWPTVVATTTMDMLEFSDAGYRVHHPSRSSPIEIPNGSTEFCPVKAMRRYLQTSGHSEGPLFRALGAAQGVRALSRGGVQWIVHRRLRDAGIMTYATSLALIAGFRHEAKKAGVRELAIARQHGLKGTP